MYRFPLCEPLLQGVLIVLGMDVVMVLSRVVEGVNVVFVGAIVDGFVLVVIVVSGTVVEVVVVEGLIVVVRNR